MQLIRLGRKITLYLPESFEWLVLRAGIVTDSEIKNILADPSAYIDDELSSQMQRF